MKNFVFEISKLVSLLAAVGVGFLSLGPGWSVVMDEGARAKYFMERQRAHLEKACRESPDSIALHSQLADICEELGLYQDAFRCREKLIELESESPTHYRDFASILSTFRVDAAAYFKCHTDEIPARVAELYRAAALRAPTDESLAREFAMSFYSFGGDFKSEAVSAWKHTLDIATNEQAGKEAHLHMARWLTKSGEYSRARRHLQRADGLQNIQLIALTEKSLATAEMEAGVSGFDSRNFAARRKLPKRHRRWRM
jgi:tetratricopeptide (TPR) repeat protein